MPENTIMKIAGWKTPSTFRRYDVQDGKDIQRASKTMEKWIAAKKNPASIGLRCKGTDQRFARK